MHAQPAVHSHIEITDTLVRLYVFLAQTMDRCLSQADYVSDPEPALHGHLVASRAAVLDMLSVNKVVKEKVEQECKQVLSLVASALTEGPRQTAALHELKIERAILKHKTMALTDLLAVFRAVDGA
jgi:hypothetical protein